MNDIIRQYFAGRKMAIATMHGKEAIIGPMLKSELGVEIVIPSNFNTDAYGTFSGEIERMVDPVEACRIKCIAACESTGCDLAIASEGSFGPHPTLFFLPGDDEIVVMIDLANNLEFKARSLSTKTNFNGDLFTSWRDAEKFARMVSFPSHGLIVRNKKEGTEGLIKGVRAWDDLEKLVEKFLSEHGQVFLETDMRAMHNPTRMTVIEEATKKLVEHILRTCPNCNTPGFEIADVRDGLPCGQCGMPTRSTLAYIYGCQKCNFKKEELYPKGKKSENPMYCDWCNP